MMELKERIRKFASAGDAIGGEATAILNLLETVSLKGESEKLPSFGLMPILHYTPGHGSNFGTR